MRIYTPDHGHVDNRHPTILLKNADARGLIIYFAIKLAHGRVQNGYPTIGLIRSIHLTMKAVGTVTSDLPVSTIDNQIIINHQLLKLSKIESFYSVNNTQVNLRQFAYKIFGNLVIIKSIFKCISNVCHRSNTSLVCSI